MTLLDDIEADLSDVFLDTEDGFAVVATVTGGTVTGVFFNEFYSANPGGLVDVSSSSPVFRVQSAGATGLIRGVQLTITGTVYRIVEPRPDGTGITDLRLQAV